MGPRTREGTAWRGATSFPLASTDGKQREGGREGGRGRWRLLTAEPGRSPSAAAESRTRVADPGERQSERRQAAEAAWASPALRRRRGEERSAAPRAAAAGPGHGAVRGEGRSLRGAGQRGRAAACMPSGRGAAVRPWRPLQHGSELLPHAGRLEPHPFQAS